MRSHAGKVAVRGNTCSSAAGESISSSQCCAPSPVCSARSPPIRRCPETIDRMAADPTAALRAIHTARAQARARAWQQAGGRAPDHGIDAGAPLVVDVDATLVTTAGPPPGWPAAGS